MRELLCHEFQDSVAQHLVQNKSILDTISKLIEANSRINRSVCRAVTQCGCVRIEAGRQQVPDGTTLSNLSSSLDTHIRGELCADCRERIETEVGTSLFYLAGTCDLLGISLYDCLIDETKRIRALGAFRLA